METETVRQSRLEKDNNGHRHKILAESDLQRQVRLRKNNECRKRKISVETEVQKKTRLEKMKNYQRLKYSNETESEKSKRCKKAIEHRKNKRCQETEKVVTQDEYLNQFDVIKNGNLHDQSWAKSNMSKFHGTNKYFVCQYTICYEAWPLKSKPKCLDKYICSRCSRDKKTPKKFSAENVMKPSPVPPELQGLSQTEEMLIACALPVMRIYIKPGGQRGYSGHCINLPQNVEELASSLPRYPKDLSVIIVKVKGRDNTFKDCVVRSQKVHSALLWLIQNNPLYTDVQINEQALNCLPNNGVPVDLLSVESEDSISYDNVEPDFGPPTDDSGEYSVFNEPNDMSSFLPVGEQQQQELNAIRNQISASEPLNWPTVDNQPVNEYETSYLATMAFPTLFPDGRGDPTNQALLRDVPLYEKIKHLVKFAEKINNKWVYRFASHPRFSYWAFNMIIKKRTLQQSGIFLKQNPGEAFLTMEQLREIAESNNSPAFISKVSRYVANIGGTNAYWHRVKEDLKAIITNVGTPTLFFTFSSADMHWPELHALFEENNNVNTNLTSEERRQNVISNPHIVDCFFAQRLENFVKYWLYDTLKVKWHWYRFEYQGRGSIHCHGTAKLNNDPGLCELTKVALKGVLAPAMKKKNPLIDDPQLDVDIEAGQKASDTACQYVDWLLSTVNPSQPDEDL